MIIFQIMWLQFLYLPKFVVPIFLSKPKKNYGVQPIRMIFELVGAIGKGTILTYHKSHELLTPSVSAGGDDMEIGLN